MRGLPSAIHSVVYVQAAGRIRVMQAKVIKDELAWAAVTWKVDS
jgi:hypothetical protein